MAVKRLSDSRGLWVNLSGGPLSYEWWHDDKAECHHFVVGERGNRPWNGWLFWTRGMPCPPSHSRSGSSKSIFSSLYTSDRCPGVSVLSVLVCVSAGKKMFLIGCQTLKKCYSLIDTRGEYIYINRLHLLKYSMWVELWGTCSLVEYFYFMRIHTLTLIIFREKYTFYHTTCY